MSTTPRKGTKQIVARGVTANYPSQADFDKAVAILEAYRHATEVERRGAVMLGDEMIDEASRKMAMQFEMRGRAAGLTPSPRQENVEAAAV